MRQTTLILAIAALVAPVLSKDRDHERVQALIREFRMSNARGMVRQRKKRLMLLGEIAKLDGIAFIIQEALNKPRHADIRNDILRILAEHAPNDPVLVPIMKEHMRKGDPNRTLARKFLLAYAINEVDTGDRRRWLLSLFRGGTVEDRFLVLNALGRVRSKHTLDAAESLAADGSWQPRPKSSIGFETIARAVSRYQGPRAARLLLLMQKDPRFHPSDADAVRAATRMWRQGDLRRYIDILELSNPDAKERAKTARFLGAAGIESARAPLWLLATDKHQPVGVRAAAAEALGGLHIARGHLAEQLGALARTGDLEVRNAALRGLGHLGVIQAAARVVEQVDGPVDAAARAVLSKLSGQPEGTDWKKWFQNCDLPKGT